MRALALIVMLAACSDLDAIETGVCGNGAIDENEDCDSPNPKECDACRLRCKDSGDACPVGYACGADLFCRAPSGVFYPTPSTTFPTNEYAVTDVNWDGAGDVVGLTSTSISVLSGDPTPVMPGQATSLFSTQTSMLTPFGRGQPVFGDFDDDTRTDVLLPSADGLAGFSSQYQSLAPHAFSFNPGGGDAMMDGVEPAVVFSFHPGFVAFLFGNPATPGQPGLLLGLLDVDSGDTGPNTTFLPVACSTIIPSPAVTYDAYVVGTTPLVALVAVRDPANHVCAFRVTIPGTGTNPFSVVTISEATIPNSTRPVFADFDGAGCPSLIVAIGKEARAATTSPCTLVSQITALPTNVTTPAVGHVPVQTGSLLYGPDALITSAGVMLVPTSRSGPALVLFASDREIDVSTFGDVDADGKLDAILGSESSNGVDVLFRNPTGFLLYRIATTGSVTNLASGDYDGNGVDDIVFTERLEGERLMVAYGTKDRPLAPVENGRFSNVISFLPVQITDSIDRQRIVLDLAVVDLPGPDQLLLTVLHGSPQRTLVSYFDPRNGGGGNFDPGTGFYTAVAGQFAPTSDPTDVIAIEWLRLKGAARLYVNIGVGSGALNQSVVPPTSPTGEPLPLWFNLSGVAEGDKCSADSFCLDGARYIALRREPADRLIGIDRGNSPRSMLIDVNTLVPQSDPNMLNPPTNQPGRVPGLEPGAGLDIVSLRRADIDGDGIEDAIAAFGSRTAGTDTIRVCVQDNFAACSSLTELANEPALLCSDVAPARAQARGLFDEPVVSNPMEPMPLVALCDDTSQGGRFVYRFVYLAGSYVATRLFEVSGSVNKLEVGDVNGDALDDILVLDTGGVPQLQAFLQCRSSDVDCRTKVNAKAEAP